jgi:hypothetical protein
MQAPMLKQELDLGDLTLDIVERLGPLARRHDLELIRTICPN